MKSSDLLKEIAAFYQEEGVYVTAEKELEDALFPSLNVHLGTDKQKRELQLKIFCHPQYLQALTKPESHRQTASHWRLSFEIHFPFKCSPKTSSEVIHTLTFINTILELPGLAFNEIHEIISFRYVLLVKQHSMDKQLLLAITGSIQLIIDLYGELIEQIAKGEMTFNDLLEQILAAEKHRV